jgi:glycosyltransferase involved in cell wall biosynthesis
MNSFFQALKAFLDETPGASSRVEVRFVGRLSKQTQNLTEKYGLNGIVRFEAHLPHRESLQRMLSSDVLLLFQFEEHGGGTAIPSKVYEYMRAGKPIFAQVCDGPSADFVREYEAGYVTRPDDRSSIQAILGELYERSQAGQLPGAFLKEPIEYSRISLTKALVQQFESLLDDSSQPLAGDGKSVGFAR